MNACLQIVRSKKKSSQCLRKHRKERTICKLQHNAMQRSISIMLLHVRFRPSLSCFASHSVHYKLKCVRTPCD